MKILIFSGDSDLCWEFVSFWENISLLRVWIFAGDLDIYSGFKFYLRIWVLLKIQIFDKFSYIYKGFGSLARSLVLIGLQGVGILHKDSQFFWWFGSYGKFQTITGDSNIFWIFENVWGPRCFTGSWDITWGFTVFLMIWILGRFEYFLRIRKFTADSGSIRCERCLLNILIFLEDVYIYKGFESSLSKDSGVYWYFRFFTKYSDIYWRFRSLLKI